MNSASVKRGLEKSLARVCCQRHQFMDGQFANNLYALPHDALVFSGAYGHGLIRNLIFGRQNGGRPIDPDQQHAGQRAADPRPFELT